MKRSGYDAIVIEGKSDHPVYLWIKDGQPEIRDASRIWGMEVALTEKAIRKDLQAERDRIGVAESVPVHEMSGRKARMLYQVGLWRHLPNYLGLCLFVPWSNEQVTAAVETITGWPISS